MPADGPILLETRAAGSGASAPDGADDWAAADDLTVLRPHRRYAVNRGQPAAAPGAHLEAYAAIARGDPERELLAVLPVGPAPPRFAALAKLRERSIDGLIATLDWGVVAWGAAARVALIVERPSGPPIAPGDGPARWPALSAAAAVDSVLHPLIPVLRLLHAAGVAHRGLRPSNLYFTDARQRSVQLGEAFSAPPGYAQPAFCEPIESAMTDASARGEGGPPDDLFALGAVLLALQLGHAPGDGQPGDQPAAALIEARLEIGSYAAMIGDLRPPTAMADLLRGLLNDDARERWTLDQTAAWLTGRTIAARPPRPPARAVRPFRLDEREYFSPRTLAAAVAADPAKAAIVLRDRTLDGWLRRGLGDQATARALQALAAGDGEKRPGHLAMRLALALDPAAPLRLRGAAAAVDGLGCALAEALGGGERLGRLCELIATRAPVAWLSAQAAPGDALSSRIDLFNRLPTLLERAGPGFGVERCCYELNPAERCRSPLLTDEWVTELADLPAALDRAAERDPPPAALCDRHIAAFIAARATRPVDGLLTALADADRASAAIGAARLLAVAQDHAAMVAVPAVTAGLAALLAPAVERFRSARRRQRIAARLAEAAGSGVIHALLAIIDDRDERLTDAAEFANAAADYRSLTLRIDSVADDTATAAAARTLGEQAAAAAAGVLVSIVAAVLLLSRLT